jgi:metaxin
VSELLKQSATIDVEGIYRDCDKAFEALSELLGEDSYFFAERRPGLFDASVFAYTSVLLGEELEWRDPRMKEQLREYQNLVEHRERILEKYFA